MTHDTPQRRAFLELAVELGALRFGTFTLKSGRESPYFFNAGILSTGRAIAALGRLYAAAIVRERYEPGVLFGPAYKGIPIAAVTAAALAEQHGVDVPFAFNRKEAKAHGEGGNVVGAALAGRVVIVDDVITAGTAVREAIGMIETAGATLAGVVLALDRQERGRGKHSAVQELATEFSVPVTAIATLDDLIALATDSPQLREHLPGMRAYRERYGVGDGDAVS